MEKVNKSQMLKLFVIASVFITPLLSTSHRSKYLYFILNILIFVLGSEAGLLSFFLHSSSEKNNKLIFSSQFSPDDHRDTSITLIPPADHHINKLITKYTLNKFDRETASQQTYSNKVADKHCSEKKPPSIFFIGGADEEEEIREEVEEELFEKAETFIGNFYKQLKMQREESWNKLKNDLYHHKLTAF